MARSVLSVALGNLTSKGLGVAREVLFAAWFGTGDVAAAFRIAQTAYLLPTQALVGDALSAGLLPIYRKLQAQHRDSARILLLVACIYGLLLSAGITSLLLLYADAVARLVAPGASSVALDLAGVLLRILALATPAYILSGTLSFVEASFGRFGSIAWRPVLLNIGSILGASLAVATGKEHWLATAILLSHLVFLSWTLWSLLQLDRLWPEGAVSRAALRATCGTFFMSMFPLLGLPLIVQSNVLIERMVSSWMGTAVIPSVDYARFVADTAVQLVAVPLSILTLAKHGGDSSDAADEHIRYVAAFVLLVSFPIATLICQNSEQIVRVLFARGAFDEPSVLLTAQILRWMGGALGMTITAYYLVKTLNAKLQNRAALVVTLSACLCSMLVNLLCWGRFGAQTVGIAVATYSAILFALSAIKLKLLAALGPHLLRVLAGCVAQFFLCSWAAQSLASTYSLVSSVLVSIAWWVLLCSAVPSFRRIALPLLSRLRKIDSK